MDLGAHKRAGLEPAPTWPTEFYFISVSRFLIQVRSKRKTQIFVVLSALNLRTIQKSYENINNIT